MSIRIIAVATALASAPAAVVLAAAPAQAVGHTVVFISGSAMVVQSAAGGQNWITISPATLPSGIASYAVSDHTAGANLTTTLPCQNTGSATVMCPRSAVSSYDVVSDDMNDTIQFPSLALDGVVHAGSGDDWIEPGTGQDDVFGDAGTDSISYRTRTAPVSMSLDFAENDGALNEHDLLGSDLEVLYGGQGNDAIVGNAAAQRLHGNEGDDVLDGGLGSDQLFGGTGMDAVDYSRRTEPVTVEVDGVAGDGEPGEDDWVPTDNEIVIGGSGDDTITGSAGDEVLDGGPGADTLSGGAGIDAVSYERRTASVVVTLNALANDGEVGERDLVRTDVEEVRGGSGNDKLTGSSSPNTLDGGPGTDTLAGGAGADVLIGGTGADTFLGGGALDTVSYADRGFPVSATIDNTANDGASGEGDNVKGDVEILRGGQAGDQLRGSSDAEKLYGGAGDDTLAGMGGADVLVGEDGADDLSGGTGADMASYAERLTNVIVTIDDVANDGRPGIPGERDNVRADVEKVVGGTGNDWLTGSAAANSLSGGPGNDQLEGLAGYDHIDGGEGFDSCVGEVQSNCP